MIAYSDDPFVPSIWMQKANVDPSQMDLRGGRYVYGPMDACTIVELRKLTQEQVETGSAVPADVFILSHGEPKDRSRTKIGGLPYWAKGRPWPTNEAGDPIPFMAQFNLTNSRDIIGETDGDILLIFAHANPWLGCVLQWETLSCPGSA